MKKESRVNRDWLMLVWFDFYVILYITLVLIIIIMFIILYCTVALLLLLLTLLSRYFFAFHCFQLIIFHCIILYCIAHLPSSIPATLLNNFFWRIILYFCVFNFYLTVTCHLFFFFLIPYHFFLYSLLCTITSGFATPTIHCHVNVTWHWQGCWVFWQLLHENSFVHLP